MHLDQLTAQIEKPTTIMVPEVASDARRIQVCGFRGIPDFRTRTINDYYARLCKAGLQGHLPSTWLSPAVREPEK